MTSSHLPYWLAAFHTPQLSQTKLSSWLAHFGSIKNLFETNCDELKLLKQADWRAVEKDIAWSQVRGHHILTLEEAAYPASLKEIHDPPFVLFVKGALAALQSQQIAIVGARNATPNGLQNASFFARALVESGLAITSGLARGIDAASHLGALQANGITIAVCGTGLHHVYPVSHQALAAAIQEKGGAIISEFPLDAAPLAYHFPKRNRLISGLSLGVLVVEAALKSGSLGTARCALEQGREVFAIPGNIHQPLYRGCHYLIRQGAKLVETVADITEELHTTLAGAQVPDKTPKLSKCLNALKPEEQQVLHVIGYEMTPFDVILLQSGLTASECSSILLRLELEGYIQSLPGGVIRHGINL
jgi:DNA processing protein